METLMILLMVCSSLTSILTEFFKKQIQMANNLLALICSAIVCSAVYVTYVLHSGTILGYKAVLAYIALVVLNWIGAMVGYDKVMQALKQIKEI